MEKPICDSLSSILDSKHIITTKKEIYNMKIVNCGKIMQVYLYESDKIRNTNDYLDELNLVKLEKELKNTKKIKFDNCESKTKSSNIISERSIIRSKLECQRLAKGNIDVWETFITLTFADNVTEPKDANKRFRYFIDKVQRVKKDFKYLCVPEFQKRGAVHYHLLTNIKINDNRLMYVQEDNNLYSHIKYWNDGFTSVELIKGDTKKIVGYIAKYMTKDIDNRLFNHHRYFYSRNLKLPIIEFIDNNKLIGSSYYNKKIQDKKLIYQNEYINPLNNSKVTFLEFQSTK